ncbi:MAG TPA: YkgJ family cysteine cluster protein [Candidatus Goldiibacteriota bacterium]|nr:YkgJ family cysteine cluster protein [Candidatus Goldiibacteriota bacterium]
MKKINFKCKKCGNCCKRGFVFIKKDEIKNLSFFLEISMKEFIKKYTENVIWLGRVLKFRDDGCIFLNKDNECIIYEKRPLQCRTFPRWEWIMKKDNWQDEIKEFCNGVK